MKIRLLFIAALWILFNCHAFAQAGMWTWVKGADTTNPIGNFGTQGVETASNNPPGFYEACEWTDTAGNFWLFGGYSRNDFWGDLWMFNPVTNNWTWVKGSGVEGNAGTYGNLGVPSISNMPPCAGYGISTWTDHNGDLWMYGGSNLESVLGDMWRYNIATNTWTWMLGRPFGAQTVYDTLGVESSLNNPGARGECSATWTDKAGYLWMYGGYNDNGAFGDLWRYNVSTNLWAWMGGSDTFNANVVYGTMGIPSASNTPGGRLAYCSWMDSYGNFWLYGGAMSNDEGVYNDMWRYEPGTGNWTWMAGTDAGINAGNYGDSCISKTGLESSSRYENRARWTDDCGNFWFYGGGAGNGNYFYNDLWNFSPITLQWTFVNGSASNFVPPVYGTMGVAAPGNNPGGRYGSLAWRSRSDELYLFGGTVDGWPMEQNNLWKFTIDPSCGNIGDTATVNLGSDTVYCSPFSRVLSAVNAAAIWSTGDTASQITVTQPGTYSVAIPVCDGYLTGSIAISQQAPINAFNFGTDTTYCSTFSRVLISGDTNTYWSTGESGIQITITSPGIYWATSTNICNTVSDTISINQSIVALQTDSDATTCGQNNGLVSVTTISAKSPYIFRWNTGASEAILNNLSAGTYTVTVTDSLGCTATASAVVDSSAALAVNITTNTNPICIGDSASICAPSGYSDYQWNIGTRDSCLQVIEAGDYYVTITDANGCSATSNHITISVYSSPPVSTSLLHDTLHAYNAVTYQWYLNDTLILGATDSIFVVHYSGTYSVGITDSNGCTAMSNGQLVNLSGILDLQNTLNLKLYPDPATDELNISYTLNESTTLQINLTDLTGRLIQNVLNEEELTGNYLKRVNTSQLAPGVYMVNFGAENGNVVLLFVKTM